jgi:hypothetical protein
LLNNGRIDLLVPAARAVLKCARSEDREILLAACNRLLDQRHTPDAVEIWNALTLKRLVTCDPLDPPHGVLLTNGRFASTPISTGFDWRMPEIEGISASREEDRGGLRITFTGEEPETCDILEQRLPVLPKAEYELEVRYRTSGIPAYAGVTWRVTSDVTSGELAETDSLFAESEGRLSARFPAPPESRLARLALHYQRASGSTRIAGYIVLREVVVRPVSAGLGGTPMLPGQIVKKGQEEQSSSGKEQQLAPFQFPSGDGPRAHCLNFPPGGASSSIRRRDAPHQEAMAALASPGKPAERARRILDHALPVGAPILDRFTPGTLCHTSFAAHLPFSISETETAISDFSCRRQAFQRESPGPRPPPGDSR